MGILIKTPSEKKMKKIDHLYNMVKDIPTNLKITPPELEVNGEMTEYTFFCDNGISKFRVGVVRYFEDEPEDEISENFIFDDFQNYIDYDYFSSLKMVVLHEINKNKKH